MIMIGASGFKFLLVPAHLGGPGQRAVKRLMLLLLFILLVLCVLPPLAVKMNVELVGAQSIYPTCEFFTAFIQGCTVVRPGL